MKEESIVKGYTLKNDDVLVLEVDANISQSIVDDLKGKLKAVFPNNTSLILGRGYKLNIINRTDY